MNADPFASYRPVLEAALTRALDSLSTSHVVLLNQQIVASNDTPRDAALLCLLTADALGARPEAATPAAVALALLDAMGSVFTELDAADVPLARYGMPRSLNAGDGFFALAQSALLHAVDGPEPEQRLAAVDLLDATCRAYADELHARLQADYTPPAPALTPAALALGALSAGASQEGVGALANGDVGAASLPADARAKIDAALQYQAHRA
jgi:hypothetical protein